MASTILSDNGVSSGSAGIKQTADSTGVLALQSTTSGGTATTAVTIDNSQNMGLGVTPSAWGGTSKALQLSAGSIESRGNTITSTQNAYFNGTNWIYSGTAAASLYAQTAGTHYWYNAPSGTAGTTATFTQAMTLDASGNLLVGTTSQFSSEKFTVSGSNSDFISIMQNASGTTPAGLRIKLSGVSNGTGGAFLYLHDTNALRCQIAGNGNVTNANNSYGSTSDERLKENIVDATPKLNDLMQVRVRNFNFIADESKTKQIGVIAQELEQTFPGLVEETTDKDADGFELETTTKSVKYSVFVPMLIKAIQEQQAILVALQATSEQQAATITTLTERISALEGAK